jgi:hypothetical protein
VRAVELALGVSVPGLEDAFGSLPVSTNFTESIKAVSAQPKFDAEVKSVLLEAVPIALRIANQLNIPGILNFSRNPYSGGEPLITK